MKTKSVIAVFFLLASFAAANAGTMIDDFETAHSAETTVAAPPTQNVGSVINPTLTALGVERDLFVSKTAGAEDERYRARVNPIGETKLRIDADAQVTGSTFVTWDGVDGNPNPFTGIDYDSLGGVNLIAGATAFEIVVSFSDIGGDIKFSVFENTGNSAADVATATLSIPGGIPADTPTAFQLPFADFTGTTSALSDAGAILMEVQNPNGAWDINIQSVQTVPEPTAFALAGLGLLMPLALRRKRSA